MITDHAQQAEFTKQLLACETPHHLTIRERFDDFLLMAHVCFAQKVNILRTGRMDDKLEGETMDYLRKRYRRPSSLGNALAVLVMALEEEPHDFLGQWYMNSDQGNKDTGQFFTPYALSEICADISLAKEDFLAAKAKGERFGIMDPAIGAASMIIPVVRKMREWNAWPWEWWVHGTDIDLRCVRMCYVQLTLLGVPAWITHGNSLSMETWKSWPTFVMAMHPYREREKSQEPPNEKISTSTESAPQSKSTNPPIIVRGKPLILRRVIPH